MEFAPATVYFRDGYAGEAKREGKVQAISPVASRRFSSSPAGSWRTGKPAG